MSILQLFRQATDPEKYGQPPPPVVAPEYTAHLPIMDDHTRALHDVLPRGVGFARPAQNRELHAQWATPNAMRQLTMGEQHAPGQLPLLPLGTFDGRLFGYNDDRAAITVAGPRAGKTSTILMPALMTYPGSVLAFDPKGELAIKSAKHRQDVLKQDVVILDGFGVTGIPSGSFNPLDELDLGSGRVVSDAYNLAIAIVVNDGKDDDSFWTEGGRELLTGVILSVLQLPAEHRNLVTVRQLLTGQHPMLRAAADRQTFKSDAQRLAYMETLLLTSMAKASKDDPALDPDILEVITGIGLMYSVMPERQRGSMLSTARIATQFLDIPGMRKILRTSHFRMRDLRENPRGLTVYLVLPPGNEIKQQYRWLRIMFELAASRLIRLGDYPRDKAPMLFMMEEFPVMGHLELIETAAPVMPGFGIKLHLVAQSITQIQRHYPHTWELLFNCAGVANFFAIIDRPTKDYISERLGQITFERTRSQFSDKNEDNRVTLPLLSPSEIEMFFARECNDHIIFIPGHAPYAMLRLTPQQVDQLRVHVQQGRLSIEPIAGRPEGLAPLKIAPSRRLRDRGPRNSPDTV